MDMTKRIYMAYGSNINREQMERRCKSAKPIGISKLDGYRLVFRGGNGSAVATVQTQKGSSVPVIVWELQKEDELALDRYEGYPYLYRKEKAKIEVAGKRILAMMYVMNEGKRLAVPGGYYYGIIAKGYTEAGFDIDILKKAVAYSCAV